MRTWTNGSKAEVDLVSQNGGFFIRKRYRPGVVPGMAMAREYLGLKALQGLEFVPQLVTFRPMRRELSISFLDGDRVLEWVLGRYGPAGLDLNSFTSFHGLDERQDIQEAFERFRRSEESEAVQLRQAIGRSYGELHRRHILHGDPSPRNLLYDGRIVYVIDFDHWRPSLTPEKIDGRSLKRWYGLDA